MAYSKIVKFQETNLTVDTFRIIPDFGIIDETISTSDFGIDVH